MKKILIIAALPLEIQAIKTLFKKYSQENIIFEFLIVGVGNLSANFELTQYLLKNPDIDFVVNIGICGKTQMASGDLFMAYRSKYISNMRETIHPLYLEFERVESLACSDKIITSEKDLGEEKYVDMESMGIEFACNRLKIPYAIFKLPFDSVSPDSLKVDKKEIITSIENIDAGKMIFSLQEFLQKNTPKGDFGDLSIWKEKFSLTFTEFEMFKKALNREIAFGKSMQEVFKLLASLNKQEIKKFLRY